MKVVLLFALLVPASLCVASQPSGELFATFKQLEEALLNGNVSDDNGEVPNLHILAERFYPSRGIGPICVPIVYQIFCNESQECSECINCSPSESYNTSFLWTKYDADAAVGAILLSYAWSGVILKGFDWEKECLFSDELLLQLRVGDLTFGNDSVVSDALKDISRQLKGYTKYSSMMRSLGDSDTRGFAIKWTDDEQERRVFHHSNTILTAELVALNIFIYLLAITVTNYSYETLYQNVKGKQNPAYPLFWGIVLLSICWNIGPSWLVLSRYGRHVSISLAVMVPLELILALLIKKQARFPLPCLRPRGCTVHGGVQFIWNAKGCFRCFLSHVVQSIAIWSIVVSATFLFYYLLAIIVAFFLRPTHTLIKIVFIKAVVVCTILNVSLIFSVSHFKFSLKKKICKHNLIATISVLTVLSFLPILGFTAFIVGGILFSPSSELNGLQGIITLIPTAFLLFVAWVSHGKLFPKGIHQADAAEEIISDLEKGHPKKEEGLPDAGGEKSSGLGNINANVKASPTKESGELSNYNSLDMREPADLGSLGPDQGETKPLLHS